MLDLQDKTYCPTLDEIGAYVGSPAWGQFCSEIKAAYACCEKIEYSACSMEPRESYFTVMVVVGPKEKEAVASILPDCTAAFQEIYRQTREWNGQRWLMIDLEDRGGLYSDVLRIIRIRRGR